jgi:PAS domain S-box-containing protein
MASYIDEAKRRCFQLGIDPTSMPTLQTVEKQIFERKQIEYQEILAIIRYFTSRFLDSVRGTPFFVCITDEFGMVLHVDGDETISKLMKDVGIIPSRRFNLETGGSSAVTIALECQKPVKLLGEDHYHTCLHSWACYCVPFHYIELGDILGTIVLMTTIDRENDLFLTLLATVVDSIEREVLLTKKNQELQTLKSELETQKERLEVDVHNRTKELEFLNAKLSSVIETAPIPICVVDKLGCTDMVNQALANYMPNYSKNELIGVPYKNLTTTSGGDYEKSLISRALKGEVIQEERVRLFNREVIAYAVPIRDGMTGEVVAAIFCLKDITEYERYRNELARLERLEVVGQMAASVAHEIRNPLTVARGYIQLLQQKSGPSIGNYFDIILEEIDRINNIINDFLSVARNRYVEKGPLDLNGVVNDIIPLIMAEMTKRGIEIEIDRCLGLSNILANEEELKQLILNLSINSLQSMESGGKLVIKTSTCHNEIVLSIEDTGCGMLESEFDKIFEPFYTTKEDGTGLGLPVCKSIVERHGGRIEVVSDKGVGTKFHIIFPLMEKIE